MFKFYLIIFSVLSLSICYIFSLEINDSPTCSSRTSRQGEGRNGRPHIIFILADDAGWNDFSFHGSPQIPTPNIDALALNGVILNSYYSAPLCTPSRGTTLAGKYAIHLGLQHYVITSGTVDGLPLSEKLLPEHLKELGYETHLIGKWHLGHARKVYTPTLRGFDSHFGYFLGKQDYYSHMCREKYGVGYDFRNNLTVDRDVFGLYNTDLFTNEAIRLIERNQGNSPLFLMVAHTAPHSGEAANPLQAPKENVDKFEESIHDENRRKYAGMVDKLDESVGKIVAALAERNMLDDSIIIFASDNGGAPDGYDLNYGSNWPLRGTKNTLWEGGTRLSACLWSPQLKPHVHTQMMHASDWLPTLLEAAQGPTDPIETTELDGVSQWKSLLGVESPPRDEFIYNIDDHYNNSAVRYGKWKLIKGNTTSTDLDGCPNQSCDSWFGPSGRAPTPTVNLELSTGNAEGKNESNTTTVQDLLPLILSSTAGTAFKNAGFPIDEQLAREMQEQADLAKKCQEKWDDRDEIECDAFKAPCLFDIEDDPCERRNLAGENPEVVDFLLGLIKEYNATAIPTIPRWNDPDCTPSKWDYTWTYFKDLV